MSEILKCTAVLKKYGNVVALNGVNLAIESGKIIGLPQGTLGFYFSVL